MTLLDDLATTFIRKYGYTNNEAQILITLNYYHRYEDRMIKETLEFYPLQKY